MDLKKAARSAILGIAVADAVGVPVEFCSRESLQQEPVTGMRGYGTHDQKPGTWSDDTSMTLALMDSLAEKGFDIEDQMRRYVDWLWDAKYTAWDEVFDVGGTVKSAIFRYCKGTPVAECGEDGELYCGNGSLMRTLPLALYLHGIGCGWLNDVTSALIHASSAVTHANPRCLIACDIYCAIAFELCIGGSLQESIQNGVRKSFSFYNTRPEYEGELNQFTSLLTIGTWPEDMIKSGGYVLDTLQAALWCLLNSDSYANCILKAVNLGGDTDTTAAVAGGLAGLYYGEDSIPSSWMDALAKREYIIRMSETFVEKCLASLTEDPGPISSNNDSE